MTTRRVWSSAAVLGVVAMLALPRTATAAPFYTMEERAVAIASPALVYLQISFTGYVRDKATNTSIVASPIVYTRRCSGVVINPDGHVLTSRICMVPSDATLRQNALNLAGNVLIDEKKLEKAGLDEFVRAGMATSVYGGLTPGSPPSSKIAGQFNVAKSSAAEGSAISGEFVTDAAGKTEAIVVKLAQGNLPSAEIAGDSHPSVGAAVMMLGFNTPDTNPGNATFTLSAKKVQLSDITQSADGQTYRTNGDVGAYSIGGMAIDLNGRVVGMVTRDQAGSGPTTNRAIVPAAQVLQAVSQAGTSNVLGDADTAYRNGLAAYFKGDYKVALDQLDRVTKQTPLNQSAVTYRQYTVEQQAIEGDPAAVPTWVIAAVSGFVGAAASFAALMLFVRYRRRQTRRQAPWPASSEPWEPRALVAAAPADTSGALPGYATNSQVIDGQPPVDPQAFSLHFDAPQPAGQQPEDQVDNPWSPPPRWQ
ncbi:hypothetical protein Rhe02_26040 [Rhizocola hellebori]|uniref:Serine protease n=1 Tax=Rhizocola hellebori TaxID=1392758 RepID=A0A8J3Q764_9ACTN|nr:trypsin-like peptidase domain-containing protein [Rhizocola hellebori]GIH04537.1 hypothetical protein Rhe02_26040 [Rhizocola hellebori]